MNLFFLHLSPIKRTKKNILFFACKSDISNERGVIVINKHTIKGDCAWIYLQKRDGKTLKTVIDKEDLAGVLKHRWIAKVMDEKRKYVIAHVKLNGKSTTIYLHRLLTDAPSGKVVDHLNQNTLDNRKKNLRVCLTRENLQNRSSKSNVAKSGYRGVHWSNASRKWRASVKLNGELITFGLFAEIDKAKEVVQTARAELMPFSQEALAKRKQP